jgi:glutamyl-tRNA reductase
VLVVGAGAMGEGVATALQRAGGADLLVANRSAERASALADRIGGVAVAFERLDEAIGAADIIVASTGAEEHVLTVDLVKSARSGPRSARPLHIIDIAVPRDVEAGVADLAGVTVLDLDDLRDWADRGLSHRAAEAERARSIVWEEVERFGTESTARQAAPLVAALHATAEGIRRHELERFGSSLADLDDGQRNAVEALTKSIIAKLLHEPSVRLKAQAGTPQGERNAVTMRDLFDLS